MDDVAGAAGGRDDDVRIHDAGGDLGEDGGDQSGFLLDGPRDGIESDAVTGDQRQRLDVGSNHVGADPSDRTGGADDCRPGPGEIDVQAACPLQGAFDRGGDGVGVAARNGYVQTV